MLNLCKFLVILAITAPLIADQDSDAKPAPGKKKVKKHLIKTNEQVPAQLMTGKEVNSLLANNTKFMDITGRNLSKKREPIPAPIIPTFLRFGKTIPHMLKLVNTSRIQSIIEGLAQFPNRMYNQTSGLEASHWLYSKVEAALYKFHNYKDASAHKRTHMYSAQYSIMARLRGQDDQGMESERVILGAHIDSIRSRNNKENAPGANDNASGCAVLFEAMLILLESRVELRRTIEFHWYAVGEVGLQGSLDYAKLYYSRKIKIMGMLNFDMVGYDTGTKQIGFVEDFVDKPLTDFLKKCAKRYSNYTAVDWTCGYGCSDHAAWNEYKYRVTSWSEAPLNAIMHTGEDTIEQVNFVQVAEFAKLAVVSLTELGEPTFYMVP